jgi:DNA-binding NarL/FixJ family response regulator
MTLVLNSSRKRSINNLSVREIQVVELIVKEFNNDEISIQLKISKRTVESHRKNIFKKTQVKSIIGLVILAIKNNLVQI